MNFEDGDDEADLGKFFSKFYDKTFQNQLNNNSINEVKNNWIDKFEIRNNKNCTKKFFKSFFEINDTTFKQILKENITDNLIYKELKEKFSEMKNRILMENLGKKMWNKMFFEFYKSNKLNMNSLLKRLIDFYENIEKNSRCLELVLREKMIRFINVSEIENKQKKLFADMIAKEDFINVLISFNKGNDSRNY